MGFFVGFFVGFSVNENNDGSGTGMNKRQVSQYNTSVSPVEPDQLQRPKVTPTYANVMQILCKFMQLLSSPLSDSLAHSCAFAWMVWDGFWDSLPGFLWAESTSWLSNESIMCRYRCHRYLHCALSRPIQVTSGSRISRFFLKILSRFFQLIRCRLSVVFVVTDTTDTIFISTRN